MTQHAIKGIEIFRVGTWNGDTYTPKDLDDMVDAFGKVGFQPPVILGHTKETGAPAHGWVSAIRRIGDKLIADFKDVPKTLFDAIKDRRFDTVSAEVFFNLTRNGTKFRRVLRAVALLGAETPAVSGLAPLRTVVNVAEFDRIGAYEFDLEMEELEMSDLTSPSEEIDRLAKQFQLAHPQFNYSESVRRVLDDNPDLKRFYAAESEGKVRLAEVNR